MDRTTHNPTEWLTHFGLNHAVEVRGGVRTLYLSGQTASDPDGNAMHPGDLVAQYEAAWGNLLDALKSAGMDATNLVRLNFYTTDVPQFMKKAEDIVKFHVGAGAQVCSTLLGVKEFYDPALMIEIEATAVA